MQVTRLMSVDDDVAQAALYRENRDHLARWDPVRDDDYYTVETQRRLLGEALRDHEQGRMLPLGIIENGALVGRMNLNFIVRGAFQSGVVGYWLDHRHTGRGLAGVALAELIDIAFGELGLHRLEAGTLVHNLASQRVLQRAGFTQFGLAPRYLRIAGDWQDHLLFQRLADETESGESAR